ncbi:MAG: DNA polymerase III subunit delta [Nitrospiria bacterium]
MTYQEATRHLDRGLFSPCYLLSGEEPFLIQGLLRLFLEKGLDPAAADFNYDAFRGEEVNPDEVVLIAQTFPVSSPRRLIIIHDADRIKDDKGRLLTSLEHPSETTILLFVAAKPDMRKRLFSTLKKGGRVITCSRLRDKDLPQWIAQEGRRKGLQLSKEALWYLKERLGNDLFSIRQEIDKISLYMAGDIDAGKEISGKAVLEIIGGGRSHSIFELIRAVGEKDLQGSIHLLTSLLAEGEPPLLILAMLTRQWRMMAVAKEMTDAGMPASAVRGKIHLPPSLLTAFLQQLKKWRRDEIRRAFDLSLSADSQLKGGGLAPSFALEAMILDLCQAEKTLQDKKGYTPHFQAIF